VKKRFSSWFKANTWEKAKKAKNTPKRLGRFTLNNLGINKNLPQMHTDEHGRQKSQYY
jgi:hypothetical protein